MEPTSEDLVVYLAASLPVTRAACRRIVDLLPEAMQATGYYFEGVDMMPTVIDADVAEVTEFMNSADADKLGDFKGLGKPDPVVEFMNSADAENIDAIEGFGKVAVAKIIDQRPHSLASLSELLSEAQMAAARGILG